MKASEAVRAIMKKEGVGTVALAARMGKASRLVSERLAQPTITTTKLNELVRVMGYKIVIVPHNARMSDDMYEIE